MAIKEWVTNYPTQQDVLATDQPDLVNSVDDTRVSQIHAVRDKADALANAVGSLLLEPGSLSYSVDVLRQTTRGAPPGSPTIYDDEFASTLNARWAWAGVGAPGAGEYHLGDGLTILGSIAGAGGWDPWTNGRVLQQGVPPTAAEFQCGAPFSLLGGQTHHQVGLFISDGTATWQNALIALLKCGGTVSMTAVLERIGGATSPVRWYEDETYQSPCYALAWDPATSKIDVKRGFDMRLMHSMYLSGVLGWTPSKVGIYTYNEGSVQPYICKVHWFRIEL